MTQLLTAKKTIVPAFFFFCEKKVKASAGKNKKRVTRVE
jgi:hypothetical protein